MSPSLTPASATEPASDSTSTRERILDVAEALFAEKGLAATAVRDIARGADLTPGSLYNYFEGKQALYEAVLERGVRPLIELLRTLGEGGDATDPAAQGAAGVQPTDYIGAIMAHLATRPHIPRLIHHEAISGGDSMARLADAWMRPLIDNAVQVARGSSQRPVWSEEELPLLMSAWLHLIFGHFAMAPLLGEILERDPLSREGLEQQTRFLRKLASLISEPTD